MKLIFYDGLCPMCNSWVKRIIAWDKQKVFKFAALEGDTAKQYLAPVFPGYLKEDTIVFLDEGKVFLRSSAFFRICSYLNLPYKFFRVGMLIPKFLRDGVYRWIASRRYKFGERYAACPIPPMEWRDRFLI